MKLIVSTAIIILLTIAPMAQDVLGGVKYEISWPVSDTKDFVWKPSFRGVGLDFRKMMSPDISIGLALDWNVFHQTTTQTTAIFDGSGHVHGNQNRIVNIFPMLVTAHYYLHGGEMLPYIGLGAGVYYIGNRNEVSIYAFEDNNWHFGLAPELGVLIPAGFDFFMQIGAKYHYPFEANNIKRPYVTMNIGFLWAAD